MEEESIFSLENLWLAKLLQKIIQEELLKHLWATPMPFFGAIPISRMTPSSLPTLLLDISAETPHYFKIICGK